MRRLLPAAVWAVALFGFSGAAGAASDAGVELLAPAVDVALPDELPPESPRRREPTAQVAVVEAERRRGQVLELTGLLPDVAGALVTDRGGFGQAKSLSLRGTSPSAVLVLLDGAPLTGPGGIADLSLVPLAVVERVEVLRGAGSRYGTGALGGVVNVATRAPDGRTRLFADATAGAFSTRVLEAGAEGPLLGGQGAAVLHVGATAGDFPFAFDDRPALVGNPEARGLRSNNDAQEAGAFLRFRRSFSPGTRHTEFDLVAQGLFLDRGLAGTVQNPTPDARQQTRRGVAAAHLETALPRGARASLRLHGLFDRTELGGGFFGARSPEHWSAVGAEVRGEWPLGDWNALNASVSLDREGLLPRHTGAVAQPTSWWRVGAQVGDDVALLAGRLLVSPSVRVDRTGPFTTFSPRLGARLELPHGLFALANLGQSHRAPSFLELYVQQGTLLPNPDLKPERGLSADAGLGLEREGLRAFLGGFSALYEDLISYEFYPPFLARPFNFAAARVSGAEVEGAYAPRPWLELTGAYALTFSQNLKDDPRYYLKELPYRPRHRGSLRAAVGPPRLQAHAELSAQSESHFNRTATLSLPARALLSVGASLVALARPRVVASVRMENVLDERASDLDGYPLPSRAFFVRVGVSWQTESGSGSP